MKHASLLHWEEVTQCLVLVVVVSVIAVSSHVRFGMRVEWFYNVWNVSKPKGIRTKKWMMKFRVRMSGSSQGCHFICLNGVLVLILQQNIQFWNSNLTQSVVCDHQVLSIYKTTCLKKTSIKQKQKLDKEDKK